MKRRRTAQGVGDDANRIAGGLVALVGLEPCRRNLPVFACKCILYEYMYHKLKQMYRYAAYAHSQITSCRSPHRSHVLYV